MSIDEYRRLGALSLYGSKKAYNEYNEYILKRDRDELLAREANLEEKRKEKEALENARMYFGDFN